MNKEELLRRARDPKNIPGIYNYCDRWCERCQFTSRCLNYDNTEERFADPESRDRDNKKFWDKLSENFRLTMELIRDAAAEQGIDLEAVDASEYMAREKQTEEEAERNVVARTAKTYARRVDRWFKANQGLLREKEKELTERGRLAFARAKVQEEAAYISDAMEVIRWYQHQIYIKLMRALTGKQEDQEDEILKEYPKDSDGSAKVALIGLDRSLAAWGRLRGYFPEQEGIILDILIQLDRIRKGTEKEFPEARGFQRPGFDYMPEANT